MDIRDIGWEGVDWIYRGPVAGFSVQGNETLFSWLAEWLSSSIWTLHYGIS